jgi:hypothetical protein
VVECPCLFVLLLLLEFFASDDDRVVRWRGEDGWSANAAATGHGEVDRRAGAAAWTNAAGGGGGGGAGTRAAGCSSSCGNGGAMTTVRRGAGGLLVELLLVVEERPDPGRERRVGRRGGGEVGARVGAAQEAGGLVVGPRRLLGGLERAEPHPYLVRGVLDLRHPPPGRPLPDAHEPLASGLAAGPLRDDDLLAAMALRLLELDLLLLCWELELWSELLGVPEFKGPEPDACRGGVRA